MTPEVKRLLSDQWAQVRALEQDIQKIVPWAFSSSEQLSSRRTDSGYHESVEDSVS
jgi:hypothetical protein